MSEAQKRQAAKNFITKWSGRGKEDEDDRSFWIDLLQDVLGQTHVTDRVQFQKKVVGADGNTKRIDAYIPETRVLIEQKSIGISLDKPQAGHDGKTPYQQAKEYDNQLPVSEKAKWIVLSNFDEFWIYDMDTKVPTAQIIKLDELQDKLSSFDFLVKEEVQRISEEVELSVRAGDLVGKIHDRFLEQYNDPMAKKTQNSLNILCVRLVFCLYAEDAGLFGHADAFKDYIEQYEPKDIRRALLDLFKVLDTPEDERADLYLDDELAAFPYVNGGLFANENIVIPKITEEIKETLIESASFDWSKISPTIFGAVFESTLNLETRRSGGMHYTSIENIHKVIDPLFLDDLKEELAGIKKIVVAKTRETKLKAYQDKLASLTWLDPAAGSGNFLTETYLSIRKLENEVIDELYQGQIVLGAGSANPIKVSISQFYGIEINDFAVAVARAALWIAESQMMKETADIVHMDLDFLPLKTNATIIEGNALQIDWSRVVSKYRLNYIMGNPPFLGAQMMQRDTQKADLMSLFEGNKHAGVLDYVCGWYIKAAQYIQDTFIKVAFVSTNSIAQGEQVPALWESLLPYNITIEFAWRTFRWDSEASSKAAVHCIVIGFCNKTIDNKKRLFSEEGYVECDIINAYLLNAPDILITSRSKPLCDVPVITKGCQPTDGGNLIIEASEFEDFIKREPKSEKYIKKLLGAREFINNLPRYCLWLVDISPNELKSMPLVMKRVAAVREMRLASSDPGTRKLADRPTEFRETYNPDSFIIIPSASSENRRYIPIGFLDNTYISTNLNLIIPDANIYHYGVLTSNVHMAWMRTVCGRLKSDYRYSKNIVYNNFPWPDPTPEQKTKVESTAQGILDARALYPNDSLADLYDPVAMPIELRKAHQDNDRAVWEAYGKAWDITSESDCVAYLMSRYKELTEGDE